jgi:hypothetical protein
MKETSAYKQVKLANCLYNLIHSEDEVTHLELADVVRQIGDYCVEKMKEETPGKPCCYSEGATEFHGDLRKNFICNLHGEQPVILVRNELWVLECGCSFAISLEGIRRLGNVSNKEEAQEKTYSYISILSL